MPTALAPQTVTNLVVEEFKRVTDVEIVPDTDTPTVIITGRNAQGKSSVLDALEAVFTGLDKRKTPRPIHEGKLAARIVAETQDLVITRTFHDKDGAVKTTLTVSAKDGAKYGSPQKMLDELYGQVTVDPWEFATMSAKDQRATLLSLVDLPFKLDEIDAQRAAKFAKRTDANREVKNLTAQVEAAKAQLPPTDAKTEEVSAGDLIARIQTASAHDRAVKDAGDRADEYEEEVTTLERRLARVKTLRDEAVAEVARLAAVESEDAEELTEQLSTIEESNRQAREAAQARARFEALVSAQRDAVDVATDLDTAITLIDQRKENGLAAASFPVPGLSFSEDGILYQGQPFEQASTAEKIRVSFAVATAKPGTIRVVLIRNAESLDSSNLELIGKLAEDAGFQVWCERVQETRELGVFHLEDGRLSQ